MESEKKKKSDSNNVSMSDGIVVAPLLKGVTISYLLTYVAGLF